MLEFTGADDELHPVELSQLGSSVEGDPQVVMKSVISGQNGV